MFSKVDYIMVNVSDMGRSVRFYRDVLGLPLRFESSDWSEFDTGASTLALHGGNVLARDESAAMPAAGTCSIGFSVANVDETYAALKAKGAQFTMPPSERECEGIRLAVCTDPDGLPVSFAQMMGR